MCNTVQQRILRERAVRITPGQRPISPDESVFVLLSFPRAEKPEDDLFPLSTLQLFVEELPKKIKSRVELLESANVFFIKVHCATVKNTPTDSDEFRTYLDRKISEVFERARSAVGLERETPTMRMGLAEMLDLIERPEQLAEAA